MPQPGTRSRPKPRRFDRRHDADIGRPGGQAVGALRRHAEAQIEKAALAPCSMPQTRGTVFR